MKKAVLIIPEGKEKNESILKAKKYCKEKGMSYGGCIEGSLDEILETPEKIMDRVMKLDPDIILTDDSFLTVGELSSQTTLLSRLEEEGIECRVTTLDMPVKELMTKLMKEIDQEVSSIHSHHVPAVILYEGEEDFQNNPDFEEMKNYIRDVLHLDHFSLMLYRRECPGLKEDLMKGFMEMTPKYVILQKPFQSEELKEMVNIIKEKGKHIEVITLEEIRETQKLLQHAVHASMLIH